MFLRIKRSNGRAYLLLVENYWEEGRHMQKIHHNFGRHDLVNPEEVDRILASKAGFAFLRGKKAGHHMVQGQ